MKRNKLTKLLSMFLVFCMMLSNSLFSFASPTISASEGNTQTNNELQAEPTENTLVLGKVLDYVDNAAFEAANHTKRLEYLEELNSYVFENEDGTRTVYMLDENVKYINEYGEIKEKDLTLKTTAKGYTTTENDISLLIPTDVSSGIGISYKGYDVKLTPQGISKASSKAFAESGAVSYDKAYGEKTSLKYTPLLSGIKEDIVLESYTGATQFSFILETDGLNLYSSKDGYYLSTDATSKAVFELGKVIIYDAVGVPDMGRMTAQTVEAGSKYIITVIANEEFLTNKDTVYPVTIDPSINVSDNNAADSIIDATIHAGYPTTNFGDVAYNRIGKRAGDFGIGRTVVKLPGLMSNSIYTQLSVNQITNVSFCVKEVLGTGTKYVNLYPLVTNTTWTETSVTWNNVGSYDIASNFGANMPAGETTAFNITNLVKQWRLGGYPNAGFIMISSDETVDKGFVSSEYFLGSSRPYVTLTYNPVVMFDDGAFTSVAEGETKTLAVTTIPTGISVTFYSMNTNIATVDQSGVVTGVNAGNTMIRVVAEYEGNFYETMINLCVTIPDGTYFIKNKMVGCFVDIEDAIMASGTNIIGTDYQASDTQRWIINYISEGFYSIKSAEDQNYYLGVENDSSSNNANIVLRNGTLSRGMKWKIEKTARGTYKLISHSGQSSSRALTSSAAPLESGYALTQTTYTNNDDYSDEWELKEFAFLFTVYNFYDKGYCTRYGETDAISINKIGSYVEAVANRYLELLGLRVITPSVSYYQSAIDSCKGVVSSDNIDLLCLHEDPHTILFNGPNSISTHFNNTYSLGSNVVTKVYWSCHEIQTNPDLDEYNRSYSSGRNIYLVSIFSSLERDLYSKGVLMHELNHQIGAPDHYHEIIDEENNICRGGDLCYDCGTNARPESCIMAHSRTDITASTVICDGCKNDIYDHLSGHH